MVPAHELCLPHPEWVFPVLKMPNGYTQKCVSMVILSPVKLVLETNSHRLAKLFEKNVGLLNDSLFMAHPFDSMIFVK